jgi:hypothetical protein
MGPKQESAPDVIAVDAPPDDGRIDLNRPGNPGGYLV